MYLPLSRCITDLYAETMQLKAINPDIKVLLSVGGWLHGTAPFTDMVSNIFIFYVSIIYYLLNVCCSFGSPYHLKYVGRGGR